jgi:hypothetical protein
MTTTPSSATRCDRILALIDACLADVESGLRVIDGDGHRTSPHRLPLRHLTLVPA